MKTQHEFRDPIHVFINVDTDERRVVDSAPVQRLRHVHQLALSYLVYPGVTHRRFEHSLGTMELAGRVFDVLVRTASGAAKDMLPELTQSKKLAYWRQVLRLAALCHDVGHLPFSHAAEHDMLPEGWNHERLTRQIITSEPMKSLLEGLEPPANAGQVAKLAVGPGKARDVVFNPWETLLSEIITGNAFGVDRIDYLLRDSHHAGVAYGRFDHFRLIDTLRILTPSPEGSGEPGPPELGVEEGGVHAAEALALARYFMFSQVYYHRVRVAYDVHLIEFLKCWRDGVPFPIAVEEHLKLTDNEVLAAMNRLRGSGEPCDEPASRILDRRHYRLLYERLPADVQKTRDAGVVIRDAAIVEFGDDAIRYGRRQDEGGRVSFPVLMSDGSIIDSTSVSTTLANVPEILMEYVLVVPERLEEARRWLQKNKDGILERGGMA